MTERARTSEELEAIVDLAMQDSVPFSAICAQYSMTTDEVVALMRKSLKKSSYRRWKERRQLGAFRKQKPREQQKGHETPKSFRSTKT